MSTTDNSRSNHNNKNNSAVGGNNQNLSFQTIQPGTLVSPMRNNANVTAYGNIGCGRSMVTSSCGKWKHWKQHQ